MPVRVDEDGSVRASEWSGHYWWLELDAQIAKLKERAERWPSREKTRDLANLERRKAEMEALRRAWMRSVVERGDGSPRFVVLLQMDELSHAGLSFDCLNPEDFLPVHEKYPDFVPGAGGIAPLSEERPAAEASLRLEHDPDEGISKAQARGQ